MLTAFLVFVASIALVAMIFIVLVQLGAMTKVKTDNMKFAMVGESLSHIMHDVRGEILNDDGQTDTGSFVRGEQKKRLGRGSLGYWWVGVPGLTSVLRFPIHREKENSDEKASFENWIIDLGTEETDTLRKTIPRSYVMNEAELLDGMAVRLLINVILEVVIPGRLVIKLKGDFFNNAGGIIKGEVGDILNDIPLEDFLTEDKGEVDGILLPLKEPKEGKDSKLNQRLIQQVGLRLTGISISRWDPANQKTRDAIEAKKTAKLAGAGRIAEAEADATALEISSAAQANATRRLVEAAAFEQKEMVEALIKQGVDPNVAATQVAALLQARAQTSLTTKVTVEGGGQSPVTIPLPTNKKE